VPEGQRRTSAIVTQPPISLLRGPLSMLLLRASLAALLLGDQARGRCWASHPPFVARAVADELRRSGVLPADDGGMMGWSQMPNLRQQHAQVLLSPQAQTEAGRGRENVRRA
jgi:hypothetical protein